jgi:transcriptional regulator with XRE-family HTH domain
MGVGQRICQLREERRLTQGELAEIIGVTRAGLSHYENDRRQPAYETLKRIAQYFNVSVEYVLEGDPQQGSKPEN